MITGRMIREIILPDIILPPGWASALSDSPFHNQAALSSGALRCFLTHLLAITLSPSLRRSHLLVFNSTARGFFSWKPLHPDVILRDSFRGSRGQFSGSAGESGGSAGESGGSAGESGGSAGESGGSAGESGGPAGESGGSAGESGGSAGEFCGPSGQFCGPPGRFCGSLPGLWVGLLPDCQQHLSFCQTPGQDWSTLPVSKSPCLRRSRLQVFRACLGL
jgi:hypothetical protein